jgi:hypothetical protein
MNVEFLNNKKNVTIYIPLIFQVDDYEPFVIEVLDIISAYLLPVQYGLTKNDLVDFFMQKDNSSDGLISFLRLKKFIAFPEDLTEIFMKYTKDSNTKCIEVSIDFSLYDSYLLFEEEIAFALKDMCIKKRPYSLGKKIMSRYCDNINI